MAGLDGVPAHEWEQLAQVLDAGIDDLSGEKQALAVERAVGRVGVSELDARDEDHVRILWDELRAATLRALLERLVAAGQLEVAGVAETGHLLHRRPAGT
jgi:methylmalonyl-CoA mutase cobalamin-binding subunit